MATRIQGITIELNADATGLDKALKDINKSLGTTNKDLAAVNKALALNPGNIELVEQKARLLGNAIDGTKDKLKALQDAQKNLKMDGTEESQRQFDALQREISTTEVKLKDLNNEMKRFGPEAIKAHTEATQFGSALKGVRDSANKVAEATAQMSAAAATALAGMVGLVTKASQFADDMLTTAQQTGLSTDALQKMAYAAERIDVPMETIVGAVRKMKSGLDSNEEVLQRLGVHVRDQHGEYRNIEDIFMESITALGQIGNETERDTVAMKLFGKSADELAGLIDDGGQRLRDLGNEAENLGLIVKQDDLEKLGEFNDKLEAMKSQLKMAAVQAAVPLLDALQPVIDGIASAITKIAEVLSNMNPKLLQVIVVVTAIIAAISPAAKIIAGIAGAILNVISVGRFLITGIQLLNTALMTLLANPVALTVIAIVAAVTLLGIAIYECVQAWNSLGDTQEERIEVAKGAIDSWMSDMRAWGDSVDQAFASAFQNMGNAVMTFAANAVNAMKPVGNACVQLGQAFLRIPEKVAKVGTSIRIWFDNIVRSARTSGQDMIKNFADGITSFIGRVTSAVQNMINSIKSIWKSGEKAAAESGKNTAKNYADAYNNGPKPKPVTASSLSPSRSGSSPNGFSSVGADRLYSAVNTLNNNISKLSGQGTQINVELVGSAKNIFDTVRVQNNMLKTATGYHALA